MAYAYILFIYFSYMYYTLEYDIIGVAYIAVSRLKKMFTFFR